MDSQNGQNGHAQDNGRPMGPPPPQKPTIAPGKVGEYVLMAADGGFYSEALRRKEDALEHAQGVANWRAQQRDDMAEVPVWVMRIEQIILANPDAKPTTEPVIPDDPAAGS